jgi:hypothetical protein
VIHPGDMITPTSTTYHLHVREASDQHMYVDGLSEVGRLIPDQLYVVVATSIVTWTNYESESDLLIYAPRIGLCWIEERFVRCIEHASNSP